MLVNTVEFILEFIQFRHCQDTLMSGCIIYMIKICCFFFTIIFRNICFNFSEIINHKVSFLFWRTDVISFLLIVLTSPFLKLNNQPQFTAIVLFLIKDNCGSHSWIQNWFHSLWKYSKDASKFAFVSFFFELLTNAPLTFQLDFHM